MENANDKPKLDSRQDDELEGRRDAMLKLGKYAAYAAPFTVFAANLNAMSGSGHGGGPLHR